MKTILKCIFGSHLYGTNTEDSDKDFKGIALPDSNDILLGKIFNTKKFGTGDDRSKNTRDDLDYDIYSLHYFIKLACEGETAAIDMLHIPDNMILETSEEWKFIQANRDKFYTKDIEQLLKYIRKNAAKYSCKGSRLATITNVMNIIGPHRFGKRMIDIWDLLPVGEHAKFVEDSPNGAKQYQLCDRILQSTATVMYSLDTLITFHNRYGERSKLAEKNEGIDWKAISHAMRAAYQLVELFEHKIITFPRPEAKLLKLIKDGFLDYRKTVEPALGDVMDKVERLGEESTLPDKADTVFWNNFLIDTCKKQIINS